MGEQPSQASTEEWCEAFPAEGHHWSYTSHAGQPRLETRTCIVCGYLSLQPTRESVARWLRDEAAKRDAMADRVPDQFGPLAERAWVLRELADELAPPSTTEP